MKLLNLARPAAAIVALTAWIGLAIQLRATCALVGTAAEAIWVLLRYFTVLTNLWLAVQLTGVALGVTRLGAPRLLAGLTVAMLLVGAVYGMLLQGLLDLSGGALLADTLMHKATPVLVAVFWLAFARKGAVRPGDPLRWLTYPLAYVAYALARGSADGKYAYPFLDAGQHGWPRVAVNIALLGAAFLAGGYAFVGLDRRLGRKAPQPSFIGS